MLEKYGGGSFCWKIFDICAILINKWEGTVMFSLSKTENHALVLVAALALMTCPSDAFAAFGALAGAGKTIFEGLKSIIYPASAIGIICVCIGGFFGNINWKWLLALIVGLIVIACCGGFIAMFAGQSGGISSAATLNGE